MHLVVRTLVLYAVLLLFFRVAGKRSLAETSTFDFILLLVISEATQQALVGGDSSLTAALIVIATFLFVDYVLSHFKLRSRSVERLLEGTPVLLVADGQLLRDRMARERVTLDDILHAARNREGLESLDQIAYAILEPSGGISIIPKR